jgi:hypothetical protein
MRGRCRTIRIHTATALVARDCSSPRPKELGTCADIPSVNAAAGEASSTQRAAGSTAVWRLTRYRNVPCPVTKRVHHLLECAEAAERTCHDDPPRRCCLPARAATCPEDGPPPPSRCFRIAFGHDNGETDARDLETSDRGRCLNGPLDAIRCANGLGMDERVIQRLQRHTVFDLGPRSPVTRPTVYARTAAKRHSRD